jgi:alkyl hydroperoxide reductase subunit AhpF
MFPGGLSEYEDRLSALGTPVRLVFFSQTFGCDSCLAARQVVDQIARLSDHISVEEHNLILDKEEASAYGIDRAPAIAVVGRSDLGIRYYGVPAGYELATLVDAVALAGTNEPRLSPATLARLETVEQPVDIKVFVTPT